MKTKLFNLTIFNLKNLTNLKNLIFFNLIIFNLINLQSSNAQMYWNHAASFSGSASSYVAVPNSSELNAPFFTLEAWVNPGNMSSTGTIIGKGDLFTSGYHLLIGTDRRLRVITNGGQRLSSKSVLPLNQWTHVAATCVADVGVQFRIFINGVLDTSLVSTGSQPSVTPDSLFIGRSFAGMLDEIRIWFRALSPTEIANNMRISLGTNGGKYYGLVLSMTFQYHANASATTIDWSDNENHGFNRGATEVDLSNIPSKTILPNLSVKFGTGGYLAGPDNSLISPTTAITLQAWINPYIDFNSTIIHKGTPTGSTTNYSLNIINRKLAAKINGIVFDSQDTIPLAEWTHVSFAYFLNGIGNVYGYRFCVNGKFVKSGSLTAANVTDGTDSLYIGGSTGLTSFPGSIDEVRISSYAKSISDINDSLYMPMAGHSNSTAAFNCDGYTWCNTGQTLGSLLYFRGNANFSTVDGITPLNKGVDLNFQKGFYMKYSDHKIPQNGYEGLMVDDSINVFLDETISDVNVYVALNHDATSDLTIDLIPPGGGRIYLANLNSTLAPSKHIATIFDDQAATSLSNNTYASFSSVVKSSGNILSFVNGTSTKGLWTLKIRDYNSSNAGRLYAWGIQFNNKSVLPKVLSCTNLMQGFYNASSNLMIRDTLRCYLRSFPFPYPIVDSAKVYLKSDGSAAFVFPSLAVTNSNGYYFQLKHRNSIETWSKNLLTFPPLLSQLAYDFTTDSAKAFGNNMIKVDSSPIEYAFYGGDVNQDGVADATDAGLIDNAAFNFTTGYVKTDVTGDNVVDASDAALTDNNAANFVTKIVP